MGSYVNICIHIRLTLIIFTIYEQRKQRGVANASSLTLQVLMTKYIGEKAKRKRGEQLRKEQEKIKKDKRSKVNKTKQRQNFRSSDQ